MKIVARVNGENHSLVETLAQLGITAKLVRGGVVVELPTQKKGPWSDPDTYEVPAEVNGATLFIDVAEEGGGMTKTGSGTVVCGLSGKALRPYCVPRGGHLSCGAHAHFSVPNAVVTVTGYRRDDNVMIKEHRIVRDGNVARIESRKLWNGELEVLPELFGRFQTAAEAAKTKGNCYHCRHVHFAEAR